jgi:hypothetical protein
MVQVPTTGHQVGLVISGGGAGRGMRSSRLFSGSSTEKSLGVSQVNSWASTKKLGLGLPITIFKL